MTGPGERELDLELERERLDLEDIESEEEEDGVGEQWRLPRICGDVAVQMCQNAASH